MWEYSIMQTPEHQYIQTGEGNYIIYSWRNKT
jgi:hypothetical protein